MRYEDWDVILFPSGRDSKIPFKEFKVACHVVPDLELVHIHGPVGLPVMTCFVPSLAAGTAFQISLHCWRRPDISQFARTHSKHADVVKFEARIMVDGRLVATTVLERDVNGPHLISSTCEFTKTGELERLRFPPFRRELLYQNYWNPGDDVGRIKIIISEGFPRDSLSSPIDRVKNIVAFSFQHAPLEILESNGIAWPNPSMWRFSALNPAMPVPTYQSEEGASSHTHSPSRSSLLLRNTRNQGLSAPITATSVFQPQVGLGMLSNSQNSAVHVPSLGQNNTGCGNAATCPDPFTDSTYLDWISSLPSGQPSSWWDGRAMWPTNSKDQRQSNSDATMPDYVPPQPSDPMHVSGSSLEDESMNLKVPTNTPTGQATDDGQKIQSQLPQQASGVPPDLALSLTQSLLNQPFHLPTQQQDAFFPCAPKEANQAVSGQNKAASAQPATQARKVEESRKVSPHHHIFAIDGLDAAAPVLACPDPSASHGNANPQFHSILSTCMRDSSVGDFGAVVTNAGCNNSAGSLSTPDCDGEVELGPGSAQSGLGTAVGNCSGHSGGTNASTAPTRTRTFTPASVKAIDAEDEPRRVTPLVRVAGFGADDTPAGVVQ